MIDYLSPEAAALKKAKRRAYYEKNKEKWKTPEAKAARKRWHEENRDHVNDQKRTRRDSRSQDEIDRERQYRKDYWVDYKAEQDNDPEINAKRRASMSRRNRIKLLEKYGLTEETWRNLFESQGKRCAICKSDHSKDKFGRWHTDHCHKTGKVRGILCTNCNRGLGMFEDNREFLRAADEYLESRVFSPDSMS